MFFIALLLPMTVYAKEPPFQLPQSYREAMRENGMRWETVPGLDDARAKSYVREKLRTLHDLVRPEADPYTGKITMPDRCRGKNLPRVFRRESSEARVTIFDLFSSAKLVLGSCSQADDVKTSQLFLYCRKTRRLYVITVFLKSGAAWPAPGLPRCNADS